MRKEPSSPLASENTQNNSGEFDDVNSLGVQAEKDSSNVNPSAEYVHSISNEYSLDITYSILFWKDMVYTNYILDVVIF